ncbi:hypothetical protein MBLNU230_g7393t1 [Neophaeotheca triangularis]
MTDASLQDIILNLEEQTWRAVKDSGAALVPFLSHDCTMIFPPGIKIDPDSDPTVEDLLRSEQFVPWLDFELSEVNVTPAGEESAIISYRVAASRPPTEGSGGRDAKFDALCSSVWRIESDGKREKGEKEKEKEKFRFRMCFHQQTLVD